MRRLQDNILAITEETIAEEVDPDLPTDIEEKDPEVAGEDIQEREQIQEKDRPETVIQEIDMAQRKKEGVIEKTERGIIENIGRDQDQEEDIEKDQIQDLEEDKKLDIGSIYIKKVTY